MIFHSSACLEHNPPTEFDGNNLRNYPESPLRVENIIQRVHAESWQVQSPSSYDREHIIRVHDADYVEFIENIPDNIGYRAPTSFNSSGEIRENSSYFAKLGQYFFDPATPISSDSKIAAIAAVDNVLAMSDALLKKKHRSASLCRPPGHHAMPSKGGGYCIFNNVAIAAEYIRNKGKSVTVLDLDYHHGNGTQEIFYDRDDVQYVSIHADPTSNYPFYWGFKDQTGEGHGKGSTINLPVDKFISESQYLQQLDTAISSVNDYNPDILLVSMGFDCYINDPIAGLSLTEESYGKIGEKLQEFGKVGLVLEGGYAIEAIGNCFVEIYKSLEE